MSISDDLMWRYIELLSFERLETIAQWKSDIANGANPRDTKVRFAQEVVARFHSQQDAEKALQDFQTRAKGGIPDDIPHYRIQIPTEGNQVVLGTIPEMVIMKVLKEVDLVSSTSEAIRLIGQHGIKIDGKKASLTDTISRGDTVVVQVGKRKFAKITLI